MVASFVFGLLGGLGVFLLGMLLLTDGLKALAGSAMRRVLRRWVRGRLSGLGWGALATALVQSSSATTLATIGLVSAGLLTFTQSLGVIMGANLGTTSTGWIVSQLGFKVSLGTIAPVIVFVGVLARLVARGRWAWFAHVGAALAGFGLLFLGIDLLQDGMAGLAERLAGSDGTVHALPAFLRGGTFIGQLALVGVGAVMTLVMMSSSAAMAATLAAVASGAIDVPTAAALIVGQNIGTSPKAIAASIGAGAAAKRTALAHLLFNVVAGALALLLLGPLLWLCQWLGDAVGAGDGPTVLAAFHTLVNALGVAVLLPLAGPYARLVERLLPDRGPPATRYLSPAVAQVGPVALEAARRGLVLVLADAMDVALSQLDRAGQAPGARVRHLAGRAEGGHGRLRSDGPRAVATVRAFVHDLGKAEQGGAEIARQVALLHAADHLDDALAGLERLDPGPLGEGASTAAKVLARALTRALAPQDQPENQPEDQPDMARAAEALRPAAQELAEAHRLGRRRALALTARGRLSPDEAVTRIDALAALDDLARNLARAAHYLTDPPPPLDAATLDAAAAGEASTVETLQSERPA
ncbi:MAG: Na/Pi cotransporter family protein [Phycisphaeraceae bacterium]|nr:Na/Pi cotransporter family protein [Phycisphaeraceae bacterium]